MTRLVVVAGAAPELVGVAAGLPAVAARRSAEHDRHDGDEPSGAMAQQSAGSSARHGRAC
jgi:hypothetical protein